jgi:hypothetical protein
MALHLHRTQHSGMYLWHSTSFLLIEDYCPNWYSKTRIMPIASTARKVNENAISHVKREREAYPTAQTRLRQLRNSSV